MIFNLRDIFMFKEEEHGIFAFHTKNFIIRYEAVECSAYEQLDEMDSDLREEISCKLDSGEYLCFDANIFVFSREDLTLLSNTSIGGNIYESYEQFMDHYGIRQGNFGSYFSDLVKESIQEARSTEEYKDIIKIQNLKRKVKTF